MVNSARIGQGARRALGTLLSRRGAQGLTHVKAPRAAGLHIDRVFIDRRAETMRKRVAPSAGSGGPPSPPLEGDQSATFAFLGDPRAYGLAGPVKRIDTQGAVVFLAGENVYKVKRAIRLPFLDFSTLEKRRAACEAEIAVNRENAPRIYLDVVAVTRRGGKLAIGGAGEAVEWATHMRRFDEDATLDRIAERGALTSEFVRKLARAIHLSHQRAPTRDGERATRSLFTYLDQNEAVFAARPDLFDPARAAELAREAREALAAARPLLIARGEQGFVRRCHGDLHLRNIAVVDGEPVLFDAIEFDPDIATGDILYDLAFALMDLWERGLRAAANLLLASYLALSDEAQFSGLAALPIFMSIRAAIRAKVEAANIAHLSGAEQAREKEAARRYFLFAEAFLRPAPARLVAIGGLSGTGKSALAAALAPEIGRAPGAVVLRSDVERKHLFAVEETTRLPDAAYGEAANRETYARLARKAGLALRAGHSVVVDAVHSQPREREAAARLAADLEVAFTGLWLEAPLALRLRRVGARARDASDADARLVAAQIAAPLAESGWSGLDASSDLASLVGAARERL
jgi:aminoglycoside phosphotransferase family enzyme/predicted kinase